MNKDRIKKNLRHELASRRFFNFFYKNEWDKYISGEFEEGSDDKKLNDQKVADYLDKMVDRLLDNP